MEQRSVIEQPGPGLAAAIAAVEPADLSGFDLVEYIAALERLTSWAQARSAVAVAEFAHRRPASGDLAGARDTTVAPWAADELACRLRWSPRTAAHRLDTALALTGRLPGTLGALLAGQVDLRRAEVLVDITTGTSDAVALAVEHAVLDRAAQQTPPQLRASARRAVQRLDADNQRIRQQQSHTDRRVSLTPDADCTHELFATGITPLVATDITTWLRRTLLTKRSTDHRTADQFRSDMLTGLVRTALVQQILPDGTGGFSALPDDSTRHRRTLPRQRLHTPTPPPTEGYQPSRPLTDHVIGRDRTCRFPTCTHPAQHCDLDHTVPYPRGTTAADNLGALCRYHHRAKTAKAFALDQPEPGIFHWVTRTGHVYTVTPEPDDPP